MDEEYAEFIGIYVGDGSVDARKRKHSYEFKIVGNPKDEIEYYSFVSLLASKITGRSITPKALDCGRSIGIRFCSKILFESLNEISGTQTPQSLKRQIPKEILRNKRLAMAFLRGLFDTDGGFTIKRKHKKEAYYPVVNFSQANGRIVIQVARLLKELGINASTCLNRGYVDTRTGKTYTRSRIDIYGVHNTAAWFKTIGSHNPKILSKYAEFSSKV
ncbi:MAG: LAGLIDADG family homing endonuclease [Candidatus Micrarchaeota archaeon]